jgi:hypothetical protein
MKQARILLFLLIFIVCAALGFALSGEIQTILSAAKPTQTTGSQPINSADRQKNIVILRIDDLMQPQPTLITIWVMFIVPSDPPAAAFKLLYPSLNESTPAFGELFKLSPDRQLSNDFITGLNQYQFHWDGIVLMDNETTSVLYEWFTGDSQDFIRQPAATKEEKELVSAAEIILLKQLCNSMNIPGDQRGESPHWRALFPNHLSTNLDLQTAVYIWDALSDPRLNTHCEVLPPE